MKNPVRTKASDHGPRTLSAPRRGMSIVEATVAISIATLTVAIATQMLASAQHERQSQLQRMQAMREVDNALETAFWLDPSQLEDAALASVARTTAEGAQAAGTAPDELVITLTVADDSSMPAGTKRIDAVASYRERRSGAMITLPTLSIWRAGPSPGAKEREATP